VKRQRSFSSVVQNLWFLMQLKSFVMLDFLMKKLKTKDFFAPQRTTRSQRKVKDLMFQGF
jgi:hypothetical protein